MCRTAVASRLSLNRRRWQAHPNAVAYRVTAGLELGNGRGSEVLVTPEKEVGYVDAFAATTRFPVG